MTSSYLEYVHAKPEWSELLFQLAKANCFTAADLEANRRLRVGPDEFVHQLKAALLPPLFVLLAGIAVSLVVRVTFAGYVDHQPVLPYVGSVFQSVFTFDFQQFRDIYLLRSGQRLPIIVGAFVVSAPAIAYRKLRHIPGRVVLDVLMGVVHVEEGMVTAETTEEKVPGQRGEMVRQFNYAVNGKKLLVSEQAHQALAEGIRYRLYYLPRSKQVVAIEPVLQ